MRLIHYSDTPLTKVRSREHSEGGVYKTTGLWVSVEGDHDWPAWCQSESYGLENFKFATEVVLSETANICHLKGAGDIDAFTAQFVNHQRHPGWDYRPNWQLLRSMYQGLIIAPYCWERRLSNHTSWYYGWDCASGVIWDAEAVAELRKAELPIFTKEDEQ